MPETVLPVLAAQASIDRVWTGFWPESRAFLVYERGGGALLYSPDTPPAIYTPYRPRVPGGVAGEHLDRLYRHEGTPDGLHGNFDTAYPIGNDTATAVVLEASVSRTLETLFHETFHAHQDEHFAGDEPGFDFIDPESITASIIAKAGIERRILREALAERSDLPELAREFLAVRASRYGEMPEKTRELERIMERTEGSAELVGIDAAAAALGEKREWVIARISERLAVPLGDLAGGLQERIFRWRLYDTGAAIGLMLDRLGLEGWRDRLEGGETFERLLSEAAGFNTVVRPEVLAERALGRRDYERLLDSAVSRDLPNPEASFGTGARVVVTFPEVPGGFRGSFSGTHSALEEKLLFIEARLYTAEFSGFVLVARNVDVLFDTRDELRLAFSVAALPAIGGVSPENAPAILEQLNVETRELTIKANRAVEITMTPASMLIRILETREAP